MTSSPGFGFGSSTDTKIREDERTVPTDEGDHEKFSHYVEKDKLTEAMVMGTPVVALCGKVWVPSRAPEKFPVCPDCKDAWEQSQRRRGLRRVTGAPTSSASASPTDPHLTPALTPAWPERAAWGTAPSLRAWQTAAMRDYLERSPRDFLAVATPGAGKTTFALSVAADLIGRRIVDRITVVAPTEHLKLQWAEAAARAGIPIDPTYSAGKGKISSDYLGIAVTYAGVGVNPLALRVRTERFKTLVILDEVHHAGDALSWGEGVREAFQPATRRLALTGTPFRSDVNPIPFVTYAPGDDGIPRSVADFTYGYAEALADHVVRPVLFLAYSGEMSWRTRAGDEIAARLGEPLTKDMTNQALRTALDPSGSWIPSVLAAADKRLTEVRRHVPDAGGMVIATDQESARAYAKTLKAISGEAPTVVLSDEKGASKKIGEFTTSDARWMVAVRMVSEGVDVPRLAVGVFATTTSTPLFFAQAIGRFVRARTRGESASIFLPSVPVLLTHASEMEVARDHVLGRRITDEDDIFAAEKELMAAGRGGRRRRRRRGPALRGARLRGDLRPRALRRRPVRLGGGDGLPRHPRPARARPDARAAPAPHQRGRQGAGAQGRPGRRRRSGRRHRAGGLDPRAARRAAPRAQRAGRRLEPPHRPAARRHPRRAAQGVRWAGLSRRQRRPAARPDQRRARLGDQEVVVAHRQAAA